VWSWKGRTRSGGSVTTPPSWLEYSAQNFTGCRARRARSRSSTSSAFRIIGRPPPWAFSVRGIGPTVAFSRAAYNPRRVALPEGAEGGEHVAKGTSMRKEKKKPKQKKTAK